MVTLILSDEDAAHIRIALVDSERMLGLELWDKAVGRAVSSAIRIEPTAEPVHVPASDNGGATLNLTLCTCGYQAKTPAGLSAHRRAKHG